MGLGWMCAFCGDGVERGGLDPCAVVVISRSAAPRARQREQQLAAHAACLARVLHPDVRDVVEVLDPGSELYRGPNGAPGAGSAVPRGAARPVPVRRTGRTGGRPGRA
ncbi:hypothetical protein AB6N23_07835 [Cellulomonas sp. 179-A 9B4 NHS]|uniref:hypothetical protein n=1 Tax=Cellulomonas sp. 179-A 9B4 NHS TaxID=3142379 RepID=UPI0039A1ED6D